MSKHEETVDNMAADIADDLLQFALKRKPDIGFDMYDLSYSVALVLAKIQPDYDLANEVLCECYAVIDEVMK